MTRISVSCLSVLPRNAYKKKGVSECIHIILGDLPHRQHPLEINHGARIEKFQVLDNPRRIETDMDWDRFDPHVGLDFGEPRREHPLHRDQVAFRPFTVGGAARPFPRRRAESGEHRLREHDIAHPWLKPCRDEVG